MTTEEAAALLGVAEDVTIGDLRRRYEALHTDYQIRLTNAPTPALKKTYQQKIQELLGAADTLHPGFSTNATGGDLPSAEPMLDDLSGVAPGETRPRPGRATTPAQGSATPRASARAREATPDTPVGGTRGLPRATIMWAVAVVFLAAFLSFALLKWVQASSRATALQADTEKAQATAQGLQARVAAEDRLLFSERLRVRNLSAQTVRISTAAFVYRDASGTLKVAHSGNYDYPSWDIRPNSVAQLDALMARGRLWDGPVVYYALLVEYPGVEPFLKAGAWAEDVDRLDKVVTLKLD